MRALDHEFVDKYLSASATMFDLNNTTKKLLNIHIGIGSFTSVSTTISSHIFQRNCLQLAINTLTNFTS